MTDTGYTTGQPYNNPQHHQQHDQQLDDKTKTIDVWDSFYEDITLSINTIQSDDPSDGAMNDISSHADQSHCQTLTESDEVTLHERVHSLQDIIKGKHILISTFHE